MCSCQYRSRRMNFAQQPPSTGLQKTKASQSVGGQPLSVSRKEQRYKRGALGSVFPEQLAIRGIPDPHRTPTTSRQESTIPRKSGEHTSITTAVMPQQNRPQPRDRPRRQRVAVEVGARRGLWRIGGRQEGQREDQNTDRR